MRVLHISQRYSVAQEKRKGKAMWQNIKGRIWGVLWIIPVFLMTAGFSVHGMASSPVWAAVDGTNAVLYLPQGGEITDCQVGTVSCDNMQVTPISETEVPVKTLIILDNSLSIPQNERPVITQLLTNLIGNRMEGEQFTLVTIEDEIHYLCENESDYLTLSSAVNGIQYQNQDTQLTDNVYQAIETLFEGSPLQFSRVVIIADGVDDKEIGYTRAELQELIQKCGYPVYTVGCGPNNSEERTALLDNLFALSRITSGRSYYFGDTTDTYQIAQGVCEYNQAQQVVIPLPAQVCDGSVRGVKVVCGGQEYTAQLTMPFEKAESSSAPVPKADSTPEHTKEAVEQELPAQRMPVWMMAAIGGGAVLILVLGIGGILLAVRRKKKKKEARQEPAQDNKASEVVEIRDDGPAIRHWYDDLPSESAEDYGDFQADAGENTVRVFGSAPGSGGRSAKHLRLVDVKNASRFYETSLKGRVTVGRSSSCQITIDQASVSRRQCEVYQDAGQVYVLNCSQTNPTRVGQTVVDRPMPLRNGAVLTMGKIQMRVEII